MNHWQFLFFLYYLFSVYILGLAVNGLLARKKEQGLSFSLELAEVFLLGSIFTIGEMLLLAGLGLYYGVFLWGVIFANYLLLFNRGVRVAFLATCRKPILRDYPQVIVLGLLGILAFRNYYPLVTGDSHKIYLLAQKMWLLKGSAFVGDAGYNVGIFAPHFNAVPYALGIALFGPETLFAQLTDLSWRMAAVLLVYGYARYRFNGWWGAVGAALVIFDEHFFYSGMNACVVINGAVVAFLFAALYNFWESHDRREPARFLLALVFTIALMANKYQMCYVFVLVLAGGLAVQRNLVVKLSVLFSDRRKWFVLGLVILITAFWYGRNYILTGCPMFPVGADKTGVWNWSPEMVRVFSKIFGSPGVNIFFKYLNYFYIWHGILASKIIALISSILPMVFFVGAFRNRTDNRALAELCFWLGATFLTLLGVSLIAFSDPRAYRYLLAVMAYTAVLLMVYVLEHGFGLNKKIVQGWLGVWLCFFLVFVCYHHKKDFTCEKSTVRENWLVIADRLHMKDLIGRYYPVNVIELREWSQNQERSRKAAWDIGVGGGHARSAFLSPVRPQLGLWCTTIVKWESYTDEKAIVKDLADYGLEWVMRAEKDHLRFLTPAEYAKEAVHYERYPKTKFYNYNFPQEIADVRY